MCYNICLESLCFLLNNVFMHEHRKRGVVDMKCIVVCLLIVTRK